MPAAKTKPLETNRLTRCPFCGDAAPPPTILHIKRDRIYLKCVGEPGRVGCDFGWVIWDPRRNPASLNTIAQKLELTDLTVPELVTEVNRRIAEAPRVERKR